MRLIEDCRREHTLSVVRYPNAPQAAAVHQKCGCAVLHNRQSRGLLSETTNSKATGEDERMEGESVRVCVWGGGYKTEDGRERETILE